MTGLITACRRRVHGWLLTAGLAVEGDDPLADLHRQEAVETALDDAAESKGVPHWRDLDDTEIIEAAAWGARHDG